MSTLFKKRVGQKVGAFLPYVSAHMAAMQDASHLVTTLMARSVVTPATLLPPVAQGLCPAEIAQQLRVAASTVTRALTRHNIACARRRAPPTRHPLPPEQADLIAQFQASAWLTSQVAEALSSDAERLYLELSGQRRMPAERVQALTLLLATKP